VSAQPAAKNPSAMINEQILIEKEQQIRELQETIEILNLKVSKLEQLVRLKDNKIQKLMGQQPL
jgi:TolA-binding protein